MKLVSRQCALREGRKTYFTGKPCKHGHIAERGTRDGHCRECGYAKVKRQRAADPEKFREYHRQWRRENRDKENARKTRRKQQVRDQVCGCCTAKQRDAMYQSAHREGLTVDHIIPMSKGGRHCTANMQPLSMPENSSKGDRYDPLVEGMQYLRKLGLA